MSVTGRYLAACAGQTEALMNAREKCRARRHAKRCDERMIAKATGVRLGAGSGSQCLPEVAIFAAGHRNSRKEAVHIIK